MKTTPFSRAKIALALLLAGVVRAAAPQLPDDAALAREAARQAPRASSALAKAERQAGLLNQKVPEVGPPSPPPALDPAALAKRFEAARPPDESALFILVSFSMPAESLERLAAQAGKAGATLVLRGMVDDSMKRTAEVAAEFVKSHPGAQFQIDPTLFRRFAVTRVPAFVLSARAGDDHACGKDCDARDTFASVSGDVTLDYALDYLARRRDRRFSALAERRLKQLRGPL